MVSSRSENNTIRVSVKNTTNVTKANASSINSSNPVNASNNQAKMYEQQALAHANTSKYWSEQSETSALKSENYANSLLKNEEFIAVSGNLETIVEIGQTLKEVDVEKIVNAEQNTVENATIATTQATIATEQASNASVSATNASNSELNAKTSETNAQTSSNNANSYMQQAKTYSETAREQANIAITNAEIAITNAEIATTQASNALSSEKNAKTSETNSLTYSNNANASAIIAKEQANVAKEQAQIAKEEVAKLSTVYKYKGSVATINNLPTNANTGDVYDTQETGMNYAWNGTEWDELGGTFDVSWGSLKGSISDNTDLQTALDSKADKSSVPTKMSQLENDDKYLQNQVAFEDNNKAISIGNAYIVPNSINIGTELSGTEQNSVLIGHRAGVIRENGIAIGKNSKVNAKSGISIGYFSTVKGENSIQLGYGENATANSLQVWSHQLLDKETGKIPDERLSNNIAKITDIPDVTNFITMADVEAKNYLTEVPEEYVTDTELSTYAYDKATVDGKIADAVTGGTVDLGNYYNKGEVDDLLDDKLENQSRFNNALSVGKGNIDGGLATVIGFRNTADAPNTILIGSDNSTIGSNSVCIGEWCDAGGNNSICIGNSACTAEQNSIQLGEGFNTTPNSFQVGEHQLLNIETGKIPIERLPDDIGGAEIDTTNLVTKQEFTSGLDTKQPKGDYALKSDVITYTAGENITIENNVISASGGEIDTSNLATKTDVANKQDKFATALPLELGGLKTSTDNISYDNNGRAYLNDKAFWASIPELLPSIVGEGRNEYASFEDTMNTVDRAELSFRKLKGFNGVYPILNLEGYNAIIRNFNVGDIVMGDRVENKVQMCFGKLENDCTFVPKLICRLQGTSSDFYKFAKMMYLYEPSYTSLNTSSGAWDGNYYVEYGESNSFKTISYKRQNELGRIESFYGVKFIEKGGAYSLAWVSENGDVVELADSATFDELDFNCVIFNGYTFELPKDEVPEYYSFNPERYFVAKDTIDNVIVRMTDGTGQDKLNLKYSDDFKLNENNEISLNAEKIPTMPIGAIVPVNASNSYVPNGCLPCDGATYEREQFEDFCRNYLDKSSSLLNTCTMEEYEAEVAATGQCAKFGVDGLNTVVTDLGNTKAKINTNGVAFASLYPNGVILEFIYDGSNWALDGKVVNLSDYYITQTGTAEVGDSFTVRFGTADSFRVPLIKDTETVVTNNIDYANGQEVVSPTVNSPFIVPYDGVYICSLGANKVTSYLYINGVQSSYTYIDVDQVVLYPTFTIPLNKGDVIYWSVALTNKQSMFYPYKEEEKEKLKSFVVVANGQTNQSLMDWSAWASSLQGRLDTDVNNITNIGKANITDLLSPDYSAGVEKVWGETYTAEVSGWVWYCIRYATTGSTNLIANTCLYIDEVPMGVSGGQKSSSISQNSGLFKVGKGSTYRTQNPSAGGTSGGITVVKFFPDKGVTNA